MNYSDNIKDLPILDKPVITIGSFDGLHKGHQQIIHQVQELSKKDGTTHVIITFEPHPRQIIYPKDKELKLLTDIKEKKFLMEFYGVQHLVVVPFTIEFSQLNADEYIENFLIQWFAPGRIVIGYDHKFGLNRQGDIHYLKWYSKKYQYEVTEISQHLVSDISVSSTKIRRFLEQGDMTQVKNMLGHPYILIGQVVHGKKIGTQIGFPTANVVPDNPLKMIPPDGIYAVLIHIADKAYPSVMYIGLKPTLGQHERSLEVHIFDFNDDIYGQEVMIEFAQYIRADLKFENVEAMTAQIGLDKEKAEKILIDQQSHFIRSSESSEH